MMEQKKRNIGFFAFFISGICAISSGIVVSILQTKYNLSYDVAGTLLSMMSIGNLIAGFATGVLPSKIGMKKTIVILTIGYALGYLMMGFVGAVVLMMLAFFIVGIAKGSTINVCTILVGDNSENRMKGMNLMHGCYALGALLCPFLISATLKLNTELPMILLACCGAVLWITFATTSFEEKSKGEKTATDWSFFKNKTFWLLTGLLFCQNAAETSVTGWMVTYFKDSGIISSELSPYTVTVMWGATLIARMLIVFVFPIKNAPKAMITMGIGCIVFYFGLMNVHTQLAAILLLFAFSFSMAGLNPTAVACAGKMTNVTTMGVMLPMASMGAIIMPWIIGMVADKMGLGIGMASNIVPCVGLLLFAIAVHRYKEND